MSKEVRISRQLVQEVLARGYRIDKIIEVSHGPDPDAELVGGYFDEPGDCFVAVYDRDVDEPMLVQTQHKAG